MGALNQWLKLFSIIHLFFGFAVRRIDGFQNNVVSRRHSSLGLMQQTSSKDISFLKNPSALALVPDSVRHLSTGSTTRRRRNGVVSSPLFSTSLSTADDESSTKKLGFLAKLRWLVLFPIVSEKNKIVDQEEAMNDHIKTSS